MITPGDETPLTPMQGLVRSSSAEVIATLPGEIGYVTRYALGHVVCALADVYEPNSVHDFADRIISDLALDPADAFGVWSDLYAAGDQKALSEARRAIGLAGEGLTFLEALTVSGGLHSAGRLVELVQAGDIAAVELARATTKDASIVDRAALFGKLYCAGDKQSLDLAIEAARRHSQESGDRHYHYSERALHDMASFAVRSGDVDDVLKLIESLEDAANKASFHVELYAQGRVESLPPVLRFLETTEDQYQMKTLQRALARAGYGPALKTIRRANANPRRHQRGPQTRETRDQVEDLLVLHKTGDSTAAKRLAEAVRSDEYPGDHLLYLGWAGLGAEAITLATQLHDADPSLENKRHLLELQHDNGLWSDIFHHYLIDRHDPWLASQCVRSLGRLARASR